ncbi:unnamed protein product [[Candida] boidinii]|nr:unnamed protein product [[Candida] boidinii]
MYPGYPPPQAGGYPPYGMSPQGYMGGPIPKGAHPAMGSPYMQGGYKPHSSYSLPPQRTRPPAIGGGPSGGGPPSSGPPSAVGSAHSYPQLRVPGAGGKNDSVDGFSSNGSLVSPPSSNDHL